MPDHASTNLTWKNHDQPLLPVPTLEDTCSKYLTTVRPFLTDDEYNNTVAAVNEFIKPGGQGEELQRRLLKRAEDAKGIGNAHPVIELHSQSHATSSSLQPGTRHRTFAGVSSPSPIRKLNGSDSNRDLSSSESDQESTPTLSKRRSFVVKAVPDESNAVIPTCNSWLIDWWNEYAYLDYREPVVLNVNYFFVFPDMPIGGLKASPRAVAAAPFVFSQKLARPSTLIDMLCARAASIVYGARQFQHMLETESLVPDWAAKNVPQCMRQYAFMFNTCRIPHRPSDYVEVFPKEEGNHVAVVRKNQFFTFDLTICEEKDGKQVRRNLTVPEIEYQLRRICVAAQRTKAPPLGILTCEHRDTWADVRAQIVSSTVVNNASGKTNAQLLEQLESAAFLVCLDDINPVTREEIGRACWHGDGRNRWFDKSLQFIVFENGKAGFNGEHSMMDATPTSRLCEYISELTLGGVPSEPQFNTILPEPARLDFFVSAPVVASIERAIVSFTKASKRNDFTVLKFTNFGKDTIKTLKCSPDAFVQMAMQLAFYRMYGTCAPTYESAGMRRYAWGRTETCRSVSLESVAFVRIMEDPESSIERKAEAARTAIATQSAYMSTCLQGKGIDRHLLGLRLLLYPWESTPALFLDPAYSLSSHWTLSTSQVPANLLDGYGWGEVVPDGFGIAYMVRDKELRFNIVAVREVLDEEDNANRAGLANDSVQAWVREQMHVKEAASESNVGENVGYHVKFVEPPASIKHGLSETNKRSLKARKPAMDIDDFVEEPEDDGEAGGEGVQEDGPDVVVNVGSSPKASSIETKQSGGRRKRKHSSRPWDAEGHGGLQFSWDTYDAHALRFFWASTKCERMKILLEGALDDLRSVLQSAPAPEKPKVAAPAATPTTVPATTAAVPVETRPDTVKVTPEALPEIVPVVPVAASLTPLAPLTGKTRSDSMGLSLAYPPRRRLLELLSGMGGAGADTDSDTSSVIAGPAALRRPSVASVTNSRLREPAIVEEGAGEEGVYESLGRLDLEDGAAAGRASVGSKTKSRWRLLFGQQQ
ncbi:Choline/Carnitine o-acyltransferase-domain-containing protein [Cladochytrium replicatum]|nr:Choline/Carnitine o-acyltransferase-domain-containing protein [Cladochytrium replicatum]